jgi:hypothetical protein
MRDPDLHALTFQVSETISVLPCRVKVRHTLTENQAAATLLIMIPAGASFFGPRATREQAACRYYWPWIPKLKYVKPFGVRRFIAALGTAYRLDQAACCREFHQPLGAVLPSGLMKYGGKPPSAAVDRIVKAAMNRRTPNDPSASSPSHVAAAKYNAVLGSKPALQEVSKSKMPGIC